MDHTTKAFGRKISLALLAAAALSGCATVTAPAPQDATASATTPESHAVLRPAPSYGSMGGYRYRRFVIVNVPRAS